jgi:hypothetical protein
LLLYAKMDGVMAMWLTFGWLVVRTCHECGWQFLKHQSMKEKKRNGGCCYVGWVSRRSCEPRGLSRRSGGWEEKQ